MLNEINSLEEYRKRFSNSELTLTVEDHLWAAWASVRQIKQDFMHNRARMADLQSVKFALADLRGDLQWVTNELCELFEGSHATRQPSGNGKSGNDSRIDKI